MAEVDSLSFEERLALLVDREATERTSRRLKTRLGKARLRHNAAVEDIDFRHPRGLDKAQALSLASCDWIRRHYNLLITGPTGVGKTFLACAFGHKACQEGFTVLYVRLPRLFQELSLARGDGRYGKLLRSYARTDLLLLDDWGLFPFGDDERRDLLEILEERHERRSTVVTSQFPVKQWHDVLGDPTLADAILDRLVHNAYRIALKGDSLRRRQATSKKVTASGTRK